MTDEKTKVPGNVRSYSLGKKPKDTDIRVMKKKISQGEILCLYLLPCTH